MPEHDPTAYDAVELIRAKRDGRALTGDEIGWLISAYTGGAGDGGGGSTIADEQMSALLMAVFFRGLDAAELHAWTDAMISSGERLDLSPVGAPTVDKHSTGGVGDKVSLLLAPLVAACGAAVPQLSGRGLGHTGGTLDKLEAIPGWRAALPTAEMIKVLRDVGCVICAAGSGLAPADRKLYALRDVTGTVESIPLIASSIMSKKIAEGTAALVLDVKVGSGVFMTELPAARLLAQTMVGLGAGRGCAPPRCSPAWTCRSGGPSATPWRSRRRSRPCAARARRSGRGDLALAREMLALAGLEADPAAALADGRALDRYRGMIAAQGGDPDAALPRAEHVRGGDRGRVRLAAAPGRPGRGRGRLAAGRRAGPEGGPGQRGGRGALPG